jgi:NitT/TauT family transport system substrate-binding protein
MIKDPAAAVASIKKRDPLVSADVEKDRIKMSLDYRMITENVLKNGASNVEPVRLEGSVRDVAEAFGIKKVPPASEVYTDQYLPPRSELKIVQ